MSESEQAPVQKQKALGAALTAGSRVGSQATQFILMLVAARFLNIADFGFYSLASAAVIGLVYLGEAGWRERIILAQTEQQVAQAHSAALLGGAVLSVAGIAFGLWGASYHLVALLSCGVVLAAACAAQAGVLTRRRKMISLAVVNIVAEGAGLIAGIAAFIHGWGIYALAAARLTMLTTALCCLLAMTRYASLGSAFAHGAGEAFAFSARILASRLLSFAEQNGGLFIIGVFVGPATAGLYRAGARLASAIGEAIGEPARFFAWTMFAGSPGKKGVASEEPTIAFFKTLLAIYAPHYVGLALVSEQLVRILLGPQWAPASVVLAALAVRQLLLSPKVLSEPMLSASGAAKWIPRVGFASLGITIAAIAFAAPFGLEAIAIAQVVAALCILPIVIAIQSRFTAITWVTAISRLWGVAAATVALAAAVWLTAMLLPNWSDLPLIAAKAGAGFSAYVAVLLAVDFRWTVAVARSISRE